MFPAPVGFPGGTTPFARLSRALACVLLLAPPATLAENPVEFAATYRGDLLRNSSDGIATGTRYLDDLYVTLRADLGATPGTGTLFLGGLYNNGTLFSSDLVGDLQVVSNIEAYEAWRLFEAWFAFGGERWSLLAGLYDLNSEFDVNGAGAIFLHSSHGIGADIGQTGRNGPGIFPVSALTLRGSVSVGSGRLSAAVLDGVPGDANDPSSNRVRLDSDEGALLIAEFSRPLDESMRAWGGYWAYTERFERPFETGPPAASDGWYLGVEGRLDSSYGPLEWFVRYGRAAADVNVFADYAGAGLVTRSPLGARPDDRVGVAVASGGAGGPYRRWLEQGGSAPRARETAWELTYRLPLGEHLVLQPDIQYVQNPAANRDRGDALVLGLRFELSY